MKNTPYNIRRFAGCSASILTMTLGMLAPLPMVQAQEINLPTLPDLEEAAQTFTLKRPVTVLDINKNPQTIVGMDEGRLVIEFPNMPGAQALVPVSDKGIYLTARLPNNYNDLVVAANDGRFGPMLSQMKELVVPLSQLLLIPPSKCNFHPIVERYYEGLVLSGGTDEAVEFSMRMHWDQLPESFIALAERLIYKTIESNDPDATEQLLARLYPALPEEKFAEMAFRIADALRTQGQHALTTRIYGTLAQSSDDVLRQRSLLWAGYSSAVAGEAEEARTILNRVDELERDDDNFLTYCLARGRLGYADDDIREGLRYLSRAMVLTSIEATFKPELYYLLIRGYNQSGQSDAADRLVREFKIFYPENPWLKKYETENSTI